MKLSDHVESAPFRCWICTGCRTTSYSSRAFRKRSPSGPEEEGDHEKGCRRRREGRLLRVWRREKSITELQR